MNGYVYLLWNQSNSLFKIGYSKYPNNRLRQLQTAHVCKLGLVCMIRTKDMRSLERELHQKYTHRKVAREWFALTWDDVADIRYLAGV